MKGLAGIGLIVFLLGFGYWMVVLVGNEDPGVHLALAFGNPTEDENEIEMHVVVGVVMAAVDRTRTDKTIPTWPEWIADHFDLTDAAGNTLELARTNFSSVITADQVVGTHEFFMKVKLKVGQPYTLDYTPVVAKGQTYRYTFTAPAAPETVKQIQFKPI